MSRFWRESRACVALSSICFAPNDRSVVLLVELIKMVLCLCLMLRDERYSPRALLKRRIEDCT